MESELDNFIACKSAIDRFSAMHPYAMLISVEQKMSID
jgi:hypothetical protein